MPNFNDHVKLAEMAASRFDGRRSYEWKLMLGYWAVLLTAMIQKWKRPVMEPPGGAILGVALFLSAAIWIIQIWKANQKDKIRYDYFHWQALAALKMEGVPDDIQPAYPGYKKKCFGDWNVLFQLLVSAAIISLLCYTLVDPDVFLKD